MELAYRSMTIEDLPAAFTVRLSTDENAVTLEELRSEYGITPESLAQAMGADVRGWACTCDEQLVGFAMGDGSTGEVVVIAVRPEFVGQGIGKRLLAVVGDWLMGAGHGEIWLRSNPDPTTRAYRFYRRLGWQPSGERQGEEEILTLVASGGEGPGRRC